MQSQPAINLNADDPILRLGDVVKQTGLSKSSLYRMMKEEKFPQPIRLTEYATGWLLSDICQWKRERIEASRQEVK